MPHFYWRTRRYKVGILVELLGFLMQSFGVASPCWMEVPWTQPSHSSGETCMGLWQICHGDIWRCNDGQEKPQMVAWGLAARVLCIAGLCMSVGSVILLITSNCTDYARRTIQDKAVVWWLPICAGIISIAGIALYMIDVRVVLDTGSPSWSLILTGIGSIVMVTTAWFLFPNKERQRRAQTRTVRRARATPSDVRTPSGVRPPSGDRTPTGIRTPSGVSRTSGVQGGSSQEIHVNSAYDEAPPTYEEATRDETYC